MDEQTESQPAHGRLKLIGWVISIVGMALYGYGYFADGGAAFINWPLYLPQWAVEFVPNREAEIGFALSILGSIPLYYAEFAKR